MSSRPNALGQLALALVAGIALADASIVTLGLPSILIELDATVEGVALVLGVYTAVLALTLLPAARLARRIGAARIGAAGITLFALASLACGLSDSLGLLLVLRAVQAIGGAGALLASFELLDGGSPGSGRRLWVAASVFGVAVGPALGGALTEAFDWRAIFLAQVPIAAPRGVRLPAGGAAAGRGAGPGLHRWRRPPPPLLPAPPPPGRRPRPPLRLAYGSDLPGGPAPGLRLEHRSARGGAHRQRAAAGGARRLADPRTRRDPRGGRLPAGRRRDREPGAPARRLGLVDGFASAPGGPWDGDGAARPRRRADRRADPARTSPGC